MNYRKMPYRELQKEVFLLEHGFYDEDVAKFIKENPSKILGGDIASIKYCYISYITTTNRIYPTLQVFLEPGSDKSVVSNTNHMNNYQGEEMLFRARKEYFKDKHGIQGG